MTCQGSRKVQADQMDQLADLRKELKQIRIALLLAVIITLLAFAVLALGGFLLFLRLEVRPQVPASIQQTANPAITNNLSDPTEAIESRGERQGYYTKAQFAQLLGFSIRTLERRIAANLLSPPATVLDNGEVRIDLQTRILEK